MKNATCLLFAMLLLGEVAVEAKTIIVTQDQEIKGGTTEVLDVIILGSHKVKIYGAVCNRITVTCLCGVPSLDVDGGEGSDDIYANFYFCPSGTALLDADLDYGNQHVRVVNFCSGVRTDVYVGLTDPEPDVNTKILSPTAKVNVYRYDPQARSVGLKK